MENAICYFCPNKELFIACADSEAPGLIFEKELIYAGNFIKDDKKSQVRFSVNDHIIQHWDSTLKTMLSNGVNIPVPLDHTTNPEKNRGEIIGSRVGINLKGLPALYGKMKFRDAEAAQMAKTADVSIFVTDDYTDGKNNKYQRPIRHVALTDYPVIPGLEKFQAIAASLIPFDFEGLDMAATPALLALAQQLGIPGAEAMDDTAITAAIVAKVPKAPAPGAMPGAMPGMPPAPGAMPGMPMLPKPLMASLTNTFREGRTSKLDELVLSGNITKASRDLLAADWCSDDSLALSVTEDNASVTNEGSFANLIAALKQNKAISFDEKTGRQIVGLSNPGSTKHVSILEKDADRRAKEYVDAN